MMNRISMAATLSLLAGAACGNGTLESNNGGGEPNNGGAGGSVELGEADVAGSNPNTRVVRLSHAQYGSTLRALFGIQETPETGFAPDALNGFNFDTSNDLRVDPRL